MKVTDIIKKLNLNVHSCFNNLDKQVTGGYCSDLLSDVMGNAKEGELWITLQVHKNIIAVASLKELPAILLVKGLKPSQDVIELSEKENIPILGTDLPAFELAGKLFQLLGKK